ncbi:MAG: hypothetical protein E7315_04525 [Clostridiales bacterium]|nr:hypothetical protein [Clostridiales bacterium]
MNERPIESTINTTLEKIKEMFDANTVIGTPIVTPEATIIPYSKISLGFVSGGGELLDNTPTRKKNESAEGSSDTMNFIGGGGAGASIHPQGFIICSKDLSVRVAPAHVSTPIDRIMENLPQYIEEVKKLFEKKHT